MSRPDWIAYVAPFPFPWGQAASRRICGVAKSISDTGKHVVVCSGESTPISETNLDEVDLKGGITYIGMSEFPPKSASIGEKIYRVLLCSGQNTVNWLEMQDKKPSHVIVYGGGAQYMFRLLPWCKKHGIPLIADVVEWYDPRQLPGGRLGPFYWSSIIALRVLYNKCSGVIAISKLLEDYYCSKGVKCIRVPPTLDVSSVRFGEFRRSKNDSKLTLVYAGTPGRKDLLNNIIEAVARVDFFGERLRLLVIGPTLAEVLYLTGKASLPSGVVVLGRLKQSEVAEFVSSADFTVLLREPLRFANAGFPTKFVESLSCGTPVIANLTSDIALYLHDGVEGFVCDSHAVDALVIALNRALALSLSMLNEMRCAAREQAERSFDFRNYSVCLKDFLGRLAA